jgi:hypothetical protein
MNNIIDSTYVIKNLKVKEYNYVFDEKKEKHLGFIAHELQELVPTAVTGNKDGMDKNGNPEYQQIKPAVLVPYLVEVLQLTLKKIEVLEEKIKKIEQR